MSDLTPQAPRSTGSGLSGKLGPLPVWGWGAIVGALVLLYLYTRKKQGASTGLVTGPSVTGASPSNVSAIPIQDVATTNTGTSGVADTNSSWLQQGIKQATDLGFTPLDAETALRNYLNGTPLTQSQANIVNSVEKAQGSAPQGIGGTPSVTGSSSQSPVDQAKATVGGSPLRDQIIDDYWQILGRVPGRAEVNAWEATGASAAQIRAGIANSKEAQVTTQ